MGATGWSHFVLFQADIQRALEDLQVDVLQSGDYASIGTRSERIQQIETQLATLEDQFVDEEIREAVREELTSKINRLRSLPKAVSLSDKINELRIINVEEGTHSILDMQGVSQEPNYMRVAPINESELASIFGTSTPTREMVKQQLELLMNYRRTWMGSYIVIYKDGEPAEILFTGNSGD